MNTIPKAALAIVVIAGTVVLFLRVWGEGESARASEVLTDQGVTLSDTESRRSSNARSANHIHDRQAARDAVDTKTASQSGDINHEVRDSFAEASLNSDEIDQLLSLSTADPAALMHLAEMVAPCAMIGAWDPATLESFRHSLEGDEAHPSYRDSVAQNIENCANLLARDDLADLNPNHLMLRAARLGEPMAQIQMGIHGYGQGDISRDEARKLVHAAVESGEPRVLVDLGWAIALSKESDTERVRTRTAWVLFACDNGLDCSANSNVVHLICGETCPSAESVRELVELTMVGRDLELVNQDLATLHELFLSGEITQYIDFVMFSSQDQGAGE